MNKFLLVTALVASLASAQPHHRRHNHNHNHQHNVVKREAPSPVVAEVPGPTVVVYELNGRPIPESEVEQGIRNGSLVWAGLGYAAPSSSPSDPSSSPVAIPSSSKAVALVPTTSSAVASVAATSQPAPAASSAAAKPDPKPEVSTSSYSNTGATGLNADFPNGQLDCSTFPSKYGAMPVEWHGIGGWVGIQAPAAQKAAGYDDIMTMTKLQCISGNCCTEGSFCSYACPAGYQKSQWPTLQGATGQSVGGIQCKNGKLWLTNPDMSKKLCMTGTSKVNVKIVNKLSKNAAVCRTDYPGTESENIPLDSQPGSTLPLTCPDDKNYYTWQGKGTSAQYYVNPLGVSVQEGCQWGDGSKPIGNYAPLNLGVGWSNGMAYIGIFQNAPTTTAKLDFTVTAYGDNVIGYCKYSNGQYCSGKNYDNCNAQGCTVSASGGDVIVEFS